MCYNVYGNKKVTTTRNDSLCQEVDNLIRIATKRFGALLIVMALIVTSAFSMGISAGAATTYKPRLTAPESNNVFYYNSNYNVFQKYGYGLPNCTAYAYGRAYEILGKEPKLSWNGAGQWYGYNQTNKYYSYGSTPKLGAIACWCYSGGGHVAVVEKIENGKITLSNSEWGGRTFYLTTCSTSDKTYGGNSWWTFQGFIYLLNDATPIPPASYKTGIYKTTDYVNLRYHAGTSNTILTTIPSNTQVTVTHLYNETSTGWTWGYKTYAGKSGWFVLDYATYVSALPTTPATTVAPTTTKPTVPPTTVPPTTVAPTTTVPASTGPIYEDPVVQTEPVTEPDEDQSQIDYSKGIGMGDINADGVINIKDATMVQRYVAYVEELTIEQMEWADFDFDGFVTISDVTEIQTFLLSNS